MYVHQFVDGCGPGRRVRLLVPFAILATAILAGCVAAEVRPSPGELAGVRNIAVIAVEPPPLDATALPYHRNDLAGVNLAAAPNQAVRTAYAGALVLNGIVLLMNPDTYNAESPKPAIPLYDALTDSNAWLPTVSLAAETAEQLRARNVFSVHLEQDYRPLNGVENRGRTFFMENWMGPLRNWYNEDESSYGYQHLASRGIDGAVEVAILNYELLSGGGLLIQVMTRLVDPATRRVLGRARSAVLADAPPMSELFGNEGQNYKTFFASVTRDLVRQNLVEIGLLQ